MHNVSRETLTLIFLYIMTFLRFTKICDLFHLVKFLKFSICGSNQIISREIIERV